MFAKTDGVLAKKDSRILQDWLRFKLKVSDVKENIDNKIKGLPKASTMNAVRNSLGLPSRAKESRAQKLLCTIRNCKNALELQFVWDDNSNSPQYICEILNVTKAEAKQFHG